MAARNLDIVACYNGKIFFFLDQMPQYLLFHTTQHLEVYNVDVHTRVENRRVQDGPNMASSCFNLKSTSS